MFIAFLLMGEGFFASDSSWLHTTVKFALYHGSAEI